MTRANATALDEALTSGGPFLIRCASGNRIGAPFGLRAALLQGTSEQEAMDVAHSHGMQSALKQALRDAIKAQ